MSCDEMPTHAFTGKVEVAAPQFLKDVQELLHEASQLSSKLELVRDVRLPLRKTGLWERVIEQCPPSRR